MECNPLNILICGPGKAVENVVEGAVQDGVQSFAKAMMEGFDSLFKDFLTSWLGQGVVVDLTGPSVAWFQTSLSFMNVFLVTIGLMIAAIRTAFAAKGEPLTVAFKALGTVVFVTFGGMLAIQVLLVAGNAFAKWIMESAGLSTTQYGVAVTLWSTMPGLAIILGLFGIMATAFQWGIMFLRGAILPILAAFWPTAASMAMFKGHEGAFTKITAWLIAFIIYTPLAATIYAFAWRLKAGDDGVGGVLNSLILIALAVLALPALMRLMTPAAEAMGKAAGGAMAMGVTAATVSAGVAVGAAVASGGGSAAASGGGGGASAAAKSAPTSSGGPGAATGGDSPAGGGPEGSGKEESTGAGGANSGSQGAGSTVGSDQTTSGGQGSSSGGGPAASGGESGGGGPAASGGESGGGAPAASGGSGGGAPAASGGGSGGGSSSGPSGSELAWKAAQGGTESGGDGAGNAAEGMVSE